MVARQALTVSILALATLVTSCGRKEPPKPPPSKVPAAVNNLTVQQRGMEILLRMSYPSVTLGGLPLESLEAVEIWQMKRIIPSFLEDSASEEEGSPAALDEVGGEQPAEEDGPALALDSPQLAEEEEEEAEDEGGLLLRLPTDSAVDTLEESKEALIEVSHREFGGLAELRWALRGSELDAAVVGDSLLVRIPIAEVPEEEEVLIFAGRSLAGRRLISPFSNLAKLLLREPPKAPTAIRVEPQPSGVEINWEGNGGEKGFRVYRRNSEDRYYGSPIFSAPADGNRYLDSSAGFDQRYIYTVTSVASTNPVVESAIAAESEVHYRDLFPPSPPRDVVALPEPGRVRLLWDSSLSEDATGYNIYRQDPGGEFQPLTPEPVLGTEYLDRILAAGQTYRYFVVAVDSSGNESTASDQIEVRVP